MSATRNYTLGRCARLEIELEDGTKLISEGGIDIKQMTVNSGLGHTHTVDGLTLSNSGKSPTVEFSIECTGLITYIDPKSEDKPKKIKPRDLARIIR